MSLPVILRAEAEADVEAAREQLEGVRAGLGQQFTASLGVLLDRVESAPELYGIVWQDTRAARLKRFRYVVYYVVFADRVEVLAIIHGARDASAWQSRT